MTADTRMMGIVHDALRRDLRRAIQAVSTMPYPGETQRITLANHIVWMMDFLHVHHTGEDEGLWPRVIERDGDAAPVVDVMISDHRRVAPLIDVCRAKARAYLVDGGEGTRIALRAALDALSTGLLPHLDREENEMLPIAAAALSDTEWRAIDHEYFIKPKSLTQLGFEGHWLLDELDAERAHVVVHQVPPLPRFMLLYGFKHRYRRHVTRCWLMTSARAVQPAGRVETIVPAPIDEVWRVVSDVTRTGEWSHECRRVEWLDGAAKAAPGVRFRGTNSAGPWRWSRKNEIVTVDAPRTLVWRTISTVFYPDSSEWRFDLEEVDDGTRIVQSFRVLRGSPLMMRVYGFLVPGHRDRSERLTADLQRIGDVASRARPARLVR